MKKPVALGCLVVFLLLLVGGGTAAWMYGRPYVETMLAVRDLGKIQNIEAGVRNKSSFVAPEGGLLDKDQVQRYLSTAERVKQQLAGQVETLRVRYEQLDSGGKDLTAAQLAQGWTEIIQLVVKAKQVQVDALNANGFSLAEYGWVREQVMRAAGLPAYQVNLADLGSNSAQAGLQQSGVAVAVPAANSELVIPYTEQLQQLAPLAAFGL